MHIGNRIFPYPVLNRNEALSDNVEDSVFKVEFDVDESGAPIVQNGEVVFKNLHYTITDASLISLLEQGKMKGAFIVECSASVYRSRFEISTIPYDLKVSAHEINGNVVASCYLYAAEDIANFKSTGFIPEYAGYSFDIDKFDILAVDDGFKFKIDLDPSEDDKVASIFTVVKKEGDGDLMSCVYDEKRIVVQLPAAYYGCYDNIKTKKECNNIAFAMIAIPSLAYCLEDIYSQYGSLEEILDAHSWFNAVCISYKRKTGNALTFEEFENMSKLELAQMVLNSASCNGLKDFNNMLLGGMNHPGEEGEDEFRKSTRHFPACSHNFPKAGEARFQGLSRLFRLLGKFPYLGESRRILMAVSSKTSSKTRFYYAATRRISSAAVQPSIWA